MTQKSYSLPGEQFFKDHPLNELSTGMMLYISATAPELREKAIEVSDSMAPMGLQLPDNSEYVEKLKNEKGE